MLEAVFLERGPNCNLPRVAMGIVLGSIFWLAAKVTIEARNRNPGANIVVLSL